MCLLCALDLLAELVEHGVELVQRPQDHLLAGELPPGLDGEDDVAVVAFLDGSLGDLLRRPREDDAEQVVLDDLELPALDGEDRAVGLVHDLLRVPDAADLDDRLVAVIDMAGIELGMLLAPPQEGGGLPLEGLALEQL